MSLEQYIGEVLKRDNPKYSTLSVEAERELAIRGKTDPQARIEFIEHNLRLVVSKVMREYKTKYRLSDHEQWELIQAGNIAVQKGFDDFNIRGNEDGTGYVKFSSFIYNKGLKWAMDRSLIELRHINIPDHIDTLRKAIYAVSRDYFDRHGTYPTDNQLVKLIHIKKLTAGKIKEARDIYLNTQVTSANKPINEDGEKELSDVLVGSDGRDDSDKLSNSNLKVLLVRHLDELPEYERIILIERYFHSLTPKDISRKLNLPLERVRQKESKALRTIRNSIKKDEGISQDISAHLYA